MFIFKFNLWQQSRVMKFAWLQLSTKTRISWKEPHLLTKLTFAVDNKTVVLIEELLLFVIEQQFTDKFLWPNELEGDSEGLLLSSEPLAVWKCPCVFSVEFDELLIFDDWKCSRVWCFDLQILQVNQLLQLIILWGG